MKILFLCTAHNSLSQRLYLALASTHEITIEFALSDELMISAAQLVQPDIIICPFLTARVPKEVYDNFMTLIIHPGPPGDAGPSALDWVLMGDDGVIDNAEELLQTLNTQPCGPGRSHWGITVLQAIEQFDAGPIWAFEQFPIDIDQNGLTKSELYRGPVTRAAIKAAIETIKRIEKAADIPRRPSLADTWANRRYHPQLKAEPEYARQSVSTNLPFKGGKTHDRPLLKAAQRNFDVKRHTAQQISRRIRCADSQPGVQSKVFGVNLYVYGGQVEDTVGGPNPGAIPGAAPGTIVATRNEAVCITTCDGRGIWITHVRRLKTKDDNALWPKVPAVTGLLSLGVLDAAQVHKLQWDLPIDWSPSPHSTFQEVWVDFQSYGDSGRAAYLYFDFYNGAMATSQCSQLIEAMDYIIATSTPNDPVRAVVLMGGAYFSNGIALNVIEAASSPAHESWLNINRIDDVVHYLLHEFPSHKILTVAGIRGNAAAGGVALATACDVVLCGPEVVLNPAYRGVGLHGSEYHSLSYPGRCGEAKAKELLRSMTPISPHEARAIGLIDHVMLGSGTALEKRIKSHVAVIVKSGKPTKGIWKTRMEVGPAALANARAVELGEMGKDFYSARAIRYNTRRFNFVRKIKPKTTPLRFATHRRFEAGVTFVDEEERDSFDDVEHFAKKAERELLSQLIGQLQMNGSDSTIKPELLAAKLSVMTPEVMSIDQPNGETLFNCYYKAPETLKLPPSPVSLSSRSPSVC